MAAPLIQLSNIHLRFSAEPVLEGINLTIHQGEIVTIIGPNGAGKSSLVKVITGLIAPTTGSITHCAQGKQPLRIGYMPQTLHLDPSMPIKVSRFLSLAGPKAPSRSARKAALEQVGIANLSSAQMHNLSGGEFQRVLLARAILQRPNLLVLDEPLQGVDVNGQIELYRLIAELRQQLQCAIVMVSHDLHLVMAQTDSVVCLNRHMCCHGQPESVSKHPEYLKLFGKQASDDLAVYTHNHDHHHDMHGDVVGCSDECDHHHD
ncbi:zinc ABC transporter ATP-binding protein ZnuC [Saccharophagus degradans]|uniref:zinc ABC transporter ATP-binding protein ZnuC n=1 Tax=Saccharophagus degradans TaxID=86304 RepID=UPI0024780329|nr:zinc ABC transporter ATP-binding protein ZnuC [Saccharophagus degradans]WGO98497.1 zinc ABC transporter ATP-binding protein ZnuC [Saccharophagus degradans]